MMNNMSNQVPVTIDHPELKYQMGVMGYGYMEMSLKGSLSNEKLGLVKSLLEGVYRGVGGFVSYVVPEKEDVGM